MGYAFSTTVTILAVFVLTASSWAPELDSVHDMINKGRARYCRGEKNGRHKLTEQDVQTIRQLLSWMEITFIGELLKVSSSTIRSIKMNKIWKHLEPPTGSNEACYTVSNLNSA